MGTFYFSGATAFRGRRMDAQGAHLGAVHAGTDSPLKLLSINEVFRPCIDLNNSRDTIL